MANRVTQSQPPALTPALDSAEMAKERQQYLRQVEDFCTKARNDWYRVYLVRKLTDQHGMEFVQSLSRPGHWARWVFPKEVLEQQVSGGPGPGPPPWPPLGLLGGRCASAPVLCLCFSSSALARDAL